MEQVHVLGEAAILKKKSTLPNIVIHFFCMLKKALCTPDVPIGRETSERHFFFYFKKMRDSGRTDDV